MLTGQIEKLGAKVGERLLTPILKPVIEGAADVKDSALNSAVNSFAAYLTRSLRRQGYLNTIVFPNEPKLLEKLYVPLTLSAVGRKIETKIDTFSPDFLPALRKVLVVDSAGMGKSTLSKFLFIHATRQIAGIPVFLELRRLKAGVSVLEVVFEDLRDLSGNLKENLVRHLIDAGRFVFFLDGYDEIGDSEKAEVTQALRSFMEKAARNQFLLTSREEQGLAVFADFQRFEINRLEKEEAFSLIRKYAPQGDLAEDLIEKLKHPSNTEINEFLTNPLLTSLLFKSYEYKPNVPIKRHIFYRQVYEALFEAHDLSKDGGFVRKKKSSLDLDQFHSVLRQLGLLTLRRGRIQYSKEEILADIRAARDRLPGLSFGESDFLFDLTQAVPLIVQDGVIYRWSHKSFQEYFAAQFIAVDSKERQKEILLSFYRNSNVERFANLLQLCYDIDYKGFRHSVIRAACEQVVTHADSAYTRERFPNIPEADLIARRELTAVKRAVLVDLRPFMDEGGDVKHEKVNELIERVSASPYLQNYKFERCAVTQRTVLCFRSSASRLLEIFAGREGFEFVRVLNHQKNVDVNLEHWDGTDVYVGDDSPVSAVNRKENFAEVNRILARAMLLTVRVDRCRAALKAIQTELERERELSFDL